MDSVPSEDPDDIIQRGLFVRSPLMSVSSYGSCQLYEDEIDESLMTPRSCKSNFGQKIEKESILKQSVVKRKRNKSSPQGGKSSRKITKKTSGLPLMTRPKGSKN